jgi:2-oxoglutarate dehydrogenase E2 component (dihydrolipoamide succinyltransferase)
MSIVVKIPAVGESITEVIVGEWSVSDGEIVELDQVICEMESDKATFELNAEVAGKIKILASEGDTLKVGDAICEIDESANADRDEERGKREEGPVSADNSKNEIENQDGSNPSGGPKKPSFAKATEGKTGEVKEMIVANVGESITEVVIGSWLKEDGEFVEMDEIICEIESDKATFELPAEAGGFLLQVAKEGDTLKIGELICKIEVAEGTSDTTVAQDSPITQADQSPVATSHSSAHLSPVAANILQVKGIDPARVQGTGAGGKITKEDALNAELTASADARPEMREPRAQERKKMSNLRKTISRRLVAVKNETAMLTTFNEVNMKPIMDLRKKYKEAFKEKYEVGLGFMSFFTKACCQALLEIPAVNGQIDGDEMVYSEFCDISIAVSTERGLVVPVIRNAEMMSFDQIEKEIVILATKARDGKLTIEEMTGGTFTITNGGIFGSMLSTPIINSPQSAILGMHNIVERPMAVNGEAVILPIMYLALSYDHRIIDGKESVTFLVRVKELLEDPSRLMLGI